MNPRSIVVTGCSTGIGKACALRLDQEGFSVIATVRKPIDGETLKTLASDRLQTLLLDVTIEESLRQAQNRIGQLTDGHLFALVNNAGIGFGGPLECVPMDKVRSIWEVNVIGLLALTQQLLPFLKNPSGRILNIGSAAGQVAMPLLGAYSSSKFAVRALSDSLRLELKPLGISVIYIAPGKVESAIWEKARTHAKEFHQMADPNLLAPYQPFFDFYDKNMEATDAISADRVATAVWHACSTKTPRPVYMVGFDAKISLILSYFPTILRNWLISKAMGS